MVEVSGGSAGGRPGRGRAGERATLLLVLLTAQLWVLGAIQAWEDAPTFDEPLYLVAGVTAWQHGRLDLNFEHPPLPKLLAAAPVVALTGFEAVDERGPYRGGDPFMFSARVLAAQPRRARIALWLARLVPLTLAAGIGLLLYRLGTVLFGRPAGLVAGILWTTQPVALGFGHLLGLDLPGAFMVLLLLVVLEGTLAAPSRTRALALGVVAGAVMITRAGVGPVALLGCGITLLLGVRTLGWRRLIETTLLVGVVAWAVVWAAYLPFEAQGGVGRGIDGRESGALVRALLLVPWPSGFAAGVTYLGSLHTAEPTTGYLFGRLVVGAPPSFWAGSFVMKVTPVVLLAIPLAIVGWARLDRARRARAAVVLAPSSLLLLAMMSQAVRPLGFRYLLALLVLLLAAVAPCALALRGRWRARALVLGLALQLGMLWSSHPSSLSWGTPLAPAAWRLAADSNVDWGQDRYRLEAWVQRHPGAYVSYFGPPLADWERRLPGAVWAHRGYPWDPPLEPPPDTEWVAVSASSLNLFDRDRLPALRALCPVDILGGSILVYRVHPEQLQRSGAPHGLPADQCFGAPRSTWQPVR